MIEQEKAKKAPDCVMIIFGASGNLTHRLLLPSICHLAGHQLLSENFNVVGVASKDYNDQSFRDYLLHDIAEKVSDPKACECGKTLANKVYYIQGHFEDDKTFLNLKNRLDEMAKNEKASQNYIFYLAVPPSSFLSIIKSLHKLDMLSEQGFFRRVVIEKPFGHDLNSAIELNRAILEILEEQQIFRIDHYLGKETVQNLLAFRFANGIFEPIWNHHYIDHIQITVTEQDGIGLRGKYYDNAGALRDMIPNHLFQLLSLIAMEPPISFEANSLRDEKAKLLRSIICFTKENVLNNVVRAQYKAGKIDEKQVLGYLDEEYIAKDSTTETYIAFKLLIDNWRFSHVPFYIRTGKRLKNNVTEIAIQFKKPPAIMFQKTKSYHLSPNLLILHIQPEEGISLRFGAKIPGPVVKIGNVDMKFHYKDYFGLALGTGYETLLYDCMFGDQTLYQRQDMVETGWKIVQPIIDEWQALKSKTIPTYEAGSEGPKEADDSIKRDNRTWRSLCDK